MGTILLFYKYITIADPERIRKWILRVSQELGLKGRVLLGAEGINGTLGGSTEAIEDFKHILMSNELFQDIDFKESPGNAAMFPKLRVVIRKEIVTLGVDSSVIHPNNGGIHLKPQEVHGLLQKNDPSIVVFDARNQFESKIGAFTNAIKPPINNFRELPNYIDNNLETFKDKKVVMYCTGGIRCERASAYLKSKDVAQEVYQIEGGIHRYVEQYPDGFFRGKNYVFDGRIAVRINNDVIAQCDICKISCDDMTNCINASCNKQIVACESCIKNFNNCCSATCKELVESHQVIVRTKCAKLDAYSSSS